MTPRTTLRDLKTTGLLEIWEKLQYGERLDQADGERLFATRDVTVLGALANTVRERLHGDRTYFNRNLHINATNVCEASCIFCSFARLKTGDPGAWTMSIEAAVSRVRALKAELISEVHIVNGLNPDLPFSYYTDLLRAIKAERPELHIKGFTAVEIAYYAEKYDRSVEAVLTELRAAGLDSLPGGGAEVFADRARRKLCADKVSAEGWLDVHRTAHRLGMKSNCTLLFGSIETLAERVDHLLRLRALQDESLAWQAAHPGAGAFQTFIPLRFHNDNNGLQNLASPTGYDTLRTVAVSRLLLDNIPHIKAYWPMFGTEVAQVSQWFGASDLDGTVREEHIYHMAGARTPQELTLAGLIESIEAAGRVPVERDTLYRVLRRCDKPAAPPALSRAPVVAPVAYTNALPLIRYLDGVQVKPGHPSEVARWLQAGEVDLGLVPVAFLFGGGDWRIVPDLCIGSEGPVDSVLLVAETPIEAWTHLRLDGASRTSALLSRLLLSKGPLSKKVRADLVIEEVGIGQGVQGAGGTVAALVIGDLARELDPRFTTVLDLAQIWRDWTGLPFVFAVWAGKPDLDPRLVEAVRAGGLKGLAALGDGSLTEQLNADDRRYLTQSLRYPLDDRATMALTRFAALCKQAGLTQTDQLSLYPPPARPAPALDERRRVDATLHRAALGARLTVEELALLDAGAALPDLGAAATLRRRALLDEELARYGETGGETDRSYCHTLRLDPRATPAERAAELVAVRDLQDQSASLRAVAVLAAEGSASAVDWLRAVALTRLAIDNVPHLVAAHTEAGMGLAQAALHMGADDIGLAGLTVEDGPAEIERNLRAAGFTPQRRDSAFRAVGGPLTEPDPEGRPLRRLKAVSPSLVL